MKYKICFLSGAYRTVDADHYVIDEHLIVFIKDDKPVLTAIVDNVLFFEQVSEIDALPLKVQRGCFEARL